MEENKVLDCIPHQCSKHKVCEIKIGGAWGCYCEPGFREIETQCQGIYTCFIIIIISLFAQVHCIKMNSTIKYVSVN